MGGKSQILVSEWRFWPFGVGKFNGVSLTCSSLLTLVAMIMKIMVFEYKNGCNSRCLCCLFCAPKIPLPPKIVADYVPVVLEVSLRFLYQAGFQHPACHSILLRPTPVFMVRNIFVLQNFGSCCQRADSQSTVRLVVVHASS